MERAADSRVQLGATKKAMGRCWIPVNIDHRAQEVKDLGLKLEIMLEEFKELRRADDDFDGDRITEDRIKELVHGVNSKLQGFCV